MRHWFRGFILSILYVTLFVTDALAEELPNWDNGPVEMRDQHPLALMHLSAIPQSPEVLSKGETAGRLSFAWSNTLNRRKDTYLIDAETRVIDSTLRYGITDSSEVQFLLPIVYRGEGILDPILDDWHKMFGLPRGKRDKVDDNGFSLSGENDDGSEFALTGSGTRLGNLQLGLKSLFTKGDDTSPAWAGLIQLSLPTASGSYGHESLDVGLSLFGSKRWDDLSSYWGANYMYYGDPETQNLRFRQHRFSGYSGAEYRLFSWLQPYIGVLVKNGLLDGVSKFPNYSVYLDTGFYIPITEDTKLEFLFRENPTPRDGTVDATGLLAISCRNIF